MCAPERWPQGEEMIEIAVRPIATPPRIRDGTPETRSRRIPKKQAETMNMPRAAASIRYSGQCVRKASTAETRPETAGIAACTRLKDADAVNYSSDRTSTGDSIG